MKRRNAILGMAGAAGGAYWIGANGVPDIESILGDTAPTQNQNRVGDTVERDGLAVSVSGVNVVEQVHYPREYESDGTYKTDDGKVILIATIEVEVIGDEQIEFPESHGSMSSDITAFYYSDEISFVDRVLTTDWIRNAGGNQTIYRHAVDSISEGPYPGDDASGVMVWTVESGFDRSEIEFKIKWGGEWSKWRLAENKEYDVVTETPTETPDDSEIPM